MTDPDRRVREFWSAQHRAPEAEAHDNFLSHPLVQAYISLRAFGSLVGHLDIVAAELRTRTRPGDRIISFGCGTAAKEQALARQLPDRRFVGIDLDDETIARAQAACAAEGIANLHLEVGDCNALGLAENAFDVALGIGAIHHVERLEDFWQRCIAALVPGGVVLAQEFVGPNRLQWRAPQVAAGNRALQELVPERHKVHHAQITPTPVAEMIAIDPSEAVRSEDIVATCTQAGFTIAGYVGAGCALLQPVLMYQISTFDPRNWEHNRVLADLFVEEDRLMKAGVLGDDFAMFVAVSPK